MGATYSDAVIRHSHEIEELTEKLGPAIEILKQGGGYQVRIIPVLPDVRFVERGRDPDEMPAAKFSRIEYGRYRVVMDISEAVLDGASKDRTAARLILGALWDRFVQELAGQLERMRASRRSL